LLFVPSATTTYQAKPPDISDSLAISQEGKLFFRSFKHKVIAKAHKRSQRGGE
jgi:hypothetical protein